MGSRILAGRVISRVTMSSLVSFTTSALLFALAGSGLTYASPQTSVSDLSYPGANSVYDQDLYQQYNYPGVYDRQDVDLDLGDSVTLPALITVFLAAFLASLVGSSLVGNMTRMLSLEFKVPEPLKIRAIPLATSGQTRTLDTGLKAISELMEKYD